MDSLKILTLLLSVFALTACQSTGGVSRDYREAIEENQGLKNGNATTLVILVDGFSSSILSDSLQNGNAEHLKSYFSLAHPRGSSFSLARTVFPSLTYPNLTSILTASKVSQHGISGNRVVIGEDVVNFESVSSWKTLDQLVEGRTVFSRLASQNESSVSYSYPFPRDTTAHIEKTIQAGAHYLDHDYARIDDNSIRSLQRLVSEVPSEAWPKFVFLHLIGVDSLAHQFGPSSAQVQSYVRVLDGQLGELLFDMTRLSPKRHQLGVVLTADHGFQEIERGVDLTSIIASLGPGFRLIQDNRVASLKFPAGTSDKDRRQIARALLDVPELQATILMTSDGLETFQRTEGALTEDEELLWPAVEDYFRAPNAPDLVFLPKSNVDFSGEYSGNHGGFTQEEMLVPILHRGVKLPDTLFPSSDLLKLLGLMPLK